MSNIITSDAKVRHRQCETCPFLKGGLDLGISKMNEIHTYLLQGANHLCHSDQSHKTVCRGGRNWQLEMFHRIGWLSEPTNSALRTAMENMGIAARDHI